MFESLCSNVVLFLVLMICFIGWLFLNKIRVGIEMIWKLWVVFGLVFMLSLVMVRFVVCLVVIFLRMGVIIL